MNDAILKFSLSVLVGAAIGSANFWTLAKIYTRLLTDGAGKKPLFIILAFVKFAVLIFIIWAAIKFLPISIVGLLVGLTLALVGFVIYCYARV